MHCGICKESYPDYNAHIDSDKHKNNLKILKYFYEQIDMEIESLNKIDKVWKASPIAMGKVKSVEIDTQMGCKRTLELNNNAKEDDEDMEA